MMAFTASRASCKVPVATNRVVRARADGGTVAKTDRSGESLFFPTEQSLTYLDGSKPGDFGFDPLGLSDPEGAGGFMTPEWLAYGEIINGRYAMLGAAGMVGPELLGKVGAIPAQTNVLWFQTGVIPNGGTPEGLYQVWPLGTLIDPWALFWIEVVLMQFAELRRWQDFKNPGCMGKQYFLGLEGLLGGSGEPAYPGGPIFNFAGLAKGGEEAKVMRTKELRNGRLAMLAIFGFGAQAIMTGKGPIQNLIDHVSDPLNNNIVANFGHMYGRN